MGAPGLCLETKVKPSYASIRRLCRRLHYWFGVALAIPVLFIAVTGCILGFGHELDRLLNPDLYRSYGPNQTVSAQEILETANSGSVTPIISLQLPDSASPVWIVSQGTGRGENMGVQEELFFDLDGILLGRRLTADAPIRFIHRLHNAFLLGSDGRQVVGILSLFLLGMIITGAVVWWPAAQGIRHSFLPKIGQGMRLLLDLHTAASLWPLLLIVLVTVTGITMEFPQTTRAALGQTGQSHTMGHPARLPATPYPVSADQALNIARQSAPDDQAVSLALPSPDHPQWRITLRPEHSLWVSRRQIMVDAQTGAIQTEAAAAGGFAAFYLGAQHGLHGGSIFGLPGRLLIFLSGLCLAFLTVSGLLVWARRQRRLITEIQCIPDLKTENPS